MCFPEKQDGTISLACLYISKQNYCQLILLIMMAIYECVVILFMAGLCWSRALYPATEATETLDSQREGSSVVEERSCPTWYWKIKRNGVTRCACGATLRDTVVCDDAAQETLLIAGLCMSYDDTINETVAGRCPFNYHRPNVQFYYIAVPNDTSELNSFMCSGLNRTGLLCSQCQQGLGPAVLSYRRQCVKCLDKRYGWLVYITATLFPTTVLCFLVMIFQFHVTSAEMNCFVFLCQFMTCTNTLSNPYVYVQPDKDLTAMQFFGLAVTSFYGIWNLDFFRYFIPSFCISSDMTTLHTLALEYVVAIYPLVLIVVIYFCIEMYDRGVRVVVCVWRPFHVCFDCFGRRWNPKGSVINTFAAFLLLSYSKLLAVSYSLLDADYLFNNRGERVGPVVLYYDASIEYFSREHLPFALLAICVLLVFVLFPLLLLLLYPMRSFQRCLGYCTRIRWQFLHTFADAFQGCYKNGTNGTRDCRYFAGLYLFFRAVLLVGFISLNGYMWLIVILIPVVVSLLFAHFRPYKNDYFNIIDNLAFALLALSTFLIMYAAHTKYIPIQLLYAILLIPFLYFISFILYKIFSRVALFRSCCRKIREKFQARSDNVDEDLPDRIVNPDMYQPLLPATSGGEGNSQSDCGSQASVNSLVPYGSM